MHANHVEAVEEILTETPILDQLFQVLVRRGDDAHVDLDRRDATDTIELAIGQHAQQAGLGLGGHVTDLIEEQRAAIGLLEAPAAQRRGAGEGALLMAEQLRFHQVLGNRRHVECDERLGGARRVLMQRLGHALLAGAGLAVDQDGDMRL